MESNVLITAKVIEVDSMNFFTLWYGVFTHLGPSFEYHH